LVNVFFINKQECHAIAGTTAQCRCNFFQHPPLFHPNFGVFSSDQITHVGVSLSRGLKLFGHEIIFEIFQPMWSTDHRTWTLQTDGQTTYCGITVLCVSSRG